MGCAGLVKELTANMEKKYISVKELAIHWGVSVNTIYSWISLRKIPFHKVGRLPKFILEEIENCSMIRSFKPIE